jgi:hypothetical protein
MHDADYKAILKSINRFITYGYPRMIIGLQYQHIRASPYSNPRMTPFTRTGPAATTESHSQRLQSSITLDPPYRPRFLAPAPPLPRRAATPRHPPPTSCIEPPRTARFRNHALEHRSTGQTGPAGSTPETKGSSSRATLWNTRCSSCKLDTAPYGPACPKDSRSRTRNKARWHAGVSIDRHRPAPTTPLHHGPRAMRRAH